MRENLSTSSDLLAESDQSSQFRHLQPLSEPGSDKAIALFSETFGGNTRMALISRSGGSLTLSQRSTFTLATEFATDIRRDDHASEILVIAYRSGLAISNLMHVAAPLTTLSDITTTNPSFPFPVTTISSRYASETSPVRFGNIWAHGGTRKATTY